MLLGFLSWMLWSLRPHRAQYHIGFLWSASKSKRLCHASRPFQSSHPFLYVVTPDAVAFASSHLGPQAALTLRPETHSQIAFATHGDSSVSRLNLMHQRLQLEVSRLCLATIPRVSAARCCMITCSHIQFVNQLCNKAMHLHLNELLCPFFWDGRNRGGEGIGGSLTSLLLLTLGFLAFEMVYLIKAVDSWYQMM